MDRHTQRFEHGPIVIGKVNPGWEKTFFIPGHPFPQRAILLAVPGKDQG